MWNLTAATVLAFISFSSDYHSPRGGDFPTNFRNFTVADSACEFAVNGVSALGLAEQPLQVRLRSSRLSQRAPCMLLVYPPCTRTQHLTVVFLLPAGHYSAKRGHCSR